MTMSYVSSGKRYAQAVFELAVEKGESENWRDGLHEVAGILADIKFMSLLENPKLSFDAKKGFLMEKLGKMDKLILNLIFLLMTRGKLKILRNISRQYDRLVDAHSGIAHADVVTAVPLGDEDKERLSHRFAEMVGKKIIIDNRTDPNIIGGFKARIGDTLIDGSVYNMLELLKRRLRKAGD